MVPNRIPKNTTELGSIVIISCHNDRQAYMRMKSLKVTELNRLISDSRHHYDHEDVSKYPYIITYSILCTVIDV